MKIKSIVLLFAICGSSLTASAWREVGTGGGITEQNLTYVSVHFSKLMDGFRLHPSTHLTVLESKELDQLQLMLSSQVSLRFENQDVADKRPFKIRAGGTEWWIQTLYLGDYDFDSNDELDWFEVTALFLDLQSGAEKSSLGAEERKILKTKLQIYFQSSTQQQLMQIGRSNYFMQTTSFLDAQKNQLDFILQIEKASPLFLSPRVQMFTGCATTPTEARFTYPRLKYSSEIKAGIETLVGVNLEARCEDRPLQIELLLKVRYENEKNEIIDWGRSL